MALSPNLRGALFMSISMAGFTINDAITKMVSTPMGMGQIMLVRGLFATAMIAAFAHSQGALREWRRVAHPKVALRSAGELGATLTFLTALSMLPLANVSAVLQALPLAVTMGAALFLSEPVGWRRWAAITVGFCGVLIIIRPGFEGFNAHALLVLVTVCFAATRDLATRGIPSEVPSLLVSTVTATLVTIGGGCLMLFSDGWAPVAAGDVGLLLVAAVLLLFGYHFIIMAMRDGDISFVAPFRYTALVWAILLGFVIFGDVPDGPMIIGAAIVVGSGLYTLYRERKVGRRQPAAESTVPNPNPDGV